MGLGASYGSSFEANVIIGDSATSNAIGSAENTIAVTPFIGAYSLYLNNATEMAYAKAIGVNVDLDFGFGFCSGCQTYWNQDSNILLSNGIKDALGIYGYVANINPFNVTEGQNTIPIAIPYGASGCTWFCDLSSGNWNNSGTVMIGNDTITYRRYNTQLRKHSERHLLGPNKRDLGGSHS